MKRPAAKVLGAAGPRSPQPRLRDRRARGAESHHGELRYKFTHITQNNTYYALPPPHTGYPGQACSQARTHWQRPSFSGISAQCVRQARRDASCARPACSASQLLAPRRRAARRRRAGSPAPWPLGCLAALPLGSASRTPWANVFPQPILELLHVLRKNTQVTLKYCLHDFTQCYAFYATYAKIPLFTQNLRIITHPHPITHCTPEGEAAPPSGVVRNGCVIYRKNA